MKQEPQNQAQSVANNRKLATTLFVEAKSISETDRTLEQKLHIENCKFLYLGNLDEGGKEDET